MYENLKAYYKAIVPKLTEEAWEALEEKLTVRTLKKGELLIREGERCDEVAFINKGFMRFYNLQDGREICTAFLGENEYISEYKSFLTRLPAMENIEAMEETELWILNYNDMQELYRRFPIYETFARCIAEQLFIMLSDCVNFLLVLKPEERYQRMLMNQSVLLQRVPQYMIASYLGITPEHLSRLRKKTMSLNGVY